MTYFEDLDDETLVTIADLRDYMAGQCDEPYTTKHMKNKMMERYEDSIFITSILGKKDVVVDCHAASEMLYNMYKKQNQDIGDMKIEILTMAAKIVADDIRQMDMNQDEFFGLDDIDVDSQLQVVPGSLQVFMKNLKSKRSKADYRLKYASVGQAIINMVSRHHMPPMLVALGAEVGHLTGSAQLIHILSKCGFTCSPRMVNMFEKNAALVDFLGKSSFCEELFNVLYPLWAADNVDVKRVENSFHGMGIVLALIKLLPFGNLKIPKKRVTASQILEKRVKIFDYPSSKKEMKMVTTLLSSVSLDWYPKEAKKTCTIDLLRACASIKKPTPQFGGAMRLLCKENVKQPGKHSVFFCPLIDLKSDDLSCIYTTLLYVVSEHDKCKLPGKPVVTFDNPLWRKAMIVNHHKKLDVLILPGNFHNQMSYLGAIGYLTKNMGLLEAVQTVYGDITAKAILSGKDYEKAVRVHGLFSTALKQILIEQIPEQHQYAVEEAVKYFNALIENEDKTPFDLPEECPIVDNLMVIMNDLRAELSQNPTNRVFFMYLDWWDIFLINLESERLGQWHQYILSLKLMTPYQGAAGRRSYTKSNKWFLDVVEDLDEETKQVMENGGFVVWRSEDPYGAVSPDLNTEQTMMAQIKGRSGR